MINCQIPTPQKVVFAQKEASFPEGIYKLGEKRVLLETLDQLWKDHLLSLDHLRQGINLRAYAQRDPLNEYKTEAFQLFEGLLNSLREQTTQQLSRIRPVSQEEQDAMMRQMLAAQQAAAAEQAKAVEAAAGPAVLVAAPAAAAATRLAGFDETDPTTWGNPGRNDACPCGSGEKFKHCHGRLA